MVVLFYLLKQQFCTYFKKQILFASLKKHLFLSLNQLTHNVFAEIEKREIKIKKIKIIAFSFIIKI